jgi:D-inositol-3-phosphate glycosyltransferase
VSVVHPGVDLNVFRPGDPVQARRRLGVPDDAVVLLFAGRIQPLKAPDVLLRAVAVLLARDPSLRERLVVPVVGGPSGSGLEEPTALVDLARDLGVADVARFVPPVSQHELARWYTAASVVCVPSYSESFGLVAVEAQACGTPVVAAAVGGLTTAVDHGRTGLLVDGHEPEDYARAIARLVGDRADRARMSAAAVRHAHRFGWPRTAEQTLEVYEQAVLSRFGEPVAVHG